MIITILDPAMCCSTGVCGEDVDDVLVQTAANVKWLKSLGHQVNRHNISNDGAAFKDYPTAIKKLQQEGIDSLPYILVDNKIVMAANYPTREEWMGLLSNETSAPQHSENQEQTRARTEILISIGAAIAVANERALKQFMNQAKSLDIPFEEITKALTIGNDCRVKHSNEVIQTVNALLNEMQPATSSCCSGTGCC